MPAETKAKAPRKRAARAPIAPKAPAVAETPEETPVSETVETPKRTRKANPLVAATNRYTKAKLAYVKAAAKAAKVQDVLAAAEAAGVELAEAKADLDAVYAEVVGALVADVAE